jgi:hypothetical protein
MRQAKEKESETCTHPTAFALPLTGHIHSNVVKLPNMTCPFCMYILLHQLFPLALAPTLCLRRISWRMSRVVAQDDDEKAMERYVRERWGEVKLPSPHLIYIL